jgi:acyl carrier protein
MNREQAVQLITDSLKAMVTYSMEGASITDITQLISREGWTLDSFGLTSLVIDLESRLLDQFGKSVQIVSDKMFSIDNSPFRTVGTLADFLVELINE